jgi:hypothetical protein
MQDPWIFTDTIKIYNWMDHPDWFKCPINPDEKHFFNDVRYYCQNNECLQMVEYKRILHGYGCLKWDNETQNNYFFPTDLWKKDKIYPIELPKEAEYFYRLDFQRKEPILTSAIEEFEKPFIHKTNRWKIYYKGGSDTGSLYVNTVDKFNSDFSECGKFGMMYYPAVYIINPSEEFDKLLSDKYISEKENWWNIIHTKLSIYF